MSETVILVLLIASLLIGLVSVISILIVNKKLGDKTEQDIGLKVQQLRDSMEHRQADLRKELTDSMQNSLKMLGGIITDNQRNTDELQSRKFMEIDRHMVDKQEAMAKSLYAQFSQIENRLKSFESVNEQKMENIRNTIKDQLTSLQKDNSEKLDDMRKTVDEKLQKTLEERMTYSFRMVNERLEQVYKGLGEMQVLAEGVGDLKKVLSNVKTRGILGEVQLGAILEEIMSPEQYEKEVKTRPGSNTVVEFAIKLPAQDNSYIYLPLDSKFPLDAYSQLQDAYDLASKEALEAARGVLIARMKSFAKDIKEKYIEPPYTTEFGVMFLPSEGLYAEVVNLGLIEVLQRDYRINVAGPSTMAALLNSLQMGFQTIAIQKRSSEVWKILGAVKSEFDKFGDILKATQMRIDQANKELDKLVGVRTRAIQRKLREVEQLDSSAGNELLGIKGFEEGEEETNES